MNRQRLREAGIDYDRGVSRFLGDAALYESLLEAFLTEDDAFVGAPEAFERRDYERLFHYAHSLKGVAGNLDLARLYEAACALTELLRNDFHPCEAEAASLYQAMADAYAQTRNGIIAAMQA